MTRGSNFFKLRLATLNIQPSPIQKPTTLPQKSNLYRSLLLIHRKNLRNEKNLRFAQFSKIPHKLYRNFLCTLYRSLILFQKKKNKNSYYQYPKLKKLLNSILPLIAQNFSRDLRRPVQSKFQDEEKRTGENSIPIRSCTSAELCTLICGSS